ncbi:MAG: hypothetical protein R2838_05185 [Caldilineaceae bacterium]
MLPWPICAPGNTPGWARRTRSIWTTPAAVCGLEQARRMAMLTEHVLGNPIPTTRRRSP